MLPTSGLHIFLPDGGLEQRSVPLPRPHAHGLDPSGAVHRPPPLPPRPWLSSTRGRPPRPWLSSTHCCLPLLLEVAPLPSSSSPPARARGGRNPMEELSGRVKALLVGFSSWMVKRPIHVEAAVTTAMGPGRSGSPWARSLPMAGRRLSCHRPWHLSSRRSWYISHLIDADTTVLELNRVSRF